MVIMNRIHLYKVLRDLFGPEKPITWLAQGSYWYTDQDDRQKLLIP